MAKITKPPKDDKLLPKRKKKSSKSNVIKSKKNYSKVNKEELERGDLPISIVDHLNELRSKLLVCLFFIIIITLATLYFSDQIYLFLSKPYTSTNNQLHELKMFESMTLRLKCAFVTAIFITIPLILFNIWRYIKPAINIKQRKFFRIIFFSSALLFYSGVAFTFFILLPYIIKFGLDYKLPDVIKMTNISEYFNFIFLFLLLMGLTFNLPAIISILAKLGIITPKLLINKRKYIIVLIWIIAAIITPPDIWTMGLVAVPLMFLYEISILVCRIIVRKKYR